jgi:TonB family protein
MLALILVLTQAACSFDTAAHIRLDTLTLGLAPARDNISRELRTDYLRVAEAIREQFHRPTTLRLPFAMRVVGGKPDRGGRTPFAPFGLHGFVRFQLDSTGRLASDAIMVTSASPDIVESVVAAIQDADSMYAFPPPSKSLRRAKGQILLRFVDTVRVKQPSVALMRLIVPAVAVNEEPAVLRFPRISYPPRLRDQGVTGRVLLEFIVGSDSLVDPGSLQILDADARPFEEAVLESLKQARFRPARIGGCAVPALVRMPVDFKIVRAQVTGTVR